MSLLFHRLTDLHRLSEQQQQELCVACAHAAKEMHDVLGEARALQHLGMGSTEAADEAMAHAMGTVERALTPNHPVIADILLSRARLQNQAQNHPKVITCRARAFAPPVCTCTIGCSPTIISSGCAIVMHRRQPGILVPILPLKLWKETILL